MGDRPDPRTYVLGIAPSGAMSPLHAASWTLNTSVFKEDDNTVPLVEWLESVPAKPQAKCVAALARLEELGHELRRPEADYLRDRIYELRVRFQSVNYRMLYFFHGRIIAVVSHGCTKERAVPKREIDAAIKRKERFEKDPKKHSERFTKD